MTSLNKRLLLISAFLTLTIGVRAYVSVAPRVPVRQSLNNFPSQLGDYHSIGSSRISDDVQGVLKADDYVVRRYQDSKGNILDLFIAYYEVQRAGESMHSPKNCLPGSGWEPVLNDTVEIKKDVNGKRISVNRYLIEKQNDRALVLYWYQANGRIIASEYWGKFFLVWDALRTGRRDGSIIRMVIPMKKGDTTESITAQGLEFTRAAMPEIPAFLPN